MSKLYKLSIWAKTAAVLVIPPLFFLLVVGQAFPPKGLWAWFFWILSTFSIWLAALAGLAQLFGSSLPQWLGWDTLQILKAFEVKTKRTLKSIRDELPGINRHLDRHEVQEVWELLERGRPVLIEGESGSGKSGIAAAIVKRANNLGQPVLFIDTRHSRDFESLEKYVGVNTSLHNCLEKLASFCLESIFKRPISQVVVSDAAA